MPQIDPRPTPTLAVPRAGSPQGRRFLILTFLLVAAFSPLLWKLIRYATIEETVSHVLLVPFICIYLVRIHRSSDCIEPGRLSVPTSSLLTGGRGGGEVSRPDLRAQSPIHHPLLSSLAAILGLLALVAYWVWGRTGRLHLNDALTLATLSFYCFFLALTLATISREALRPHRFALAFFAFLIPLPIFVANALSIALQYASAEAADVTLRLTGMPVYRTGLGFQLPGLRIFVAEECSGIRSTLVLFITSLLASHLFLRTRWKKIVIVLMVFPLGVFRNALRITTISWLTVNVDSGVIDSAFHHRGGPLFFVLSLIPLFALLWWFRKSDRLRMARPTSK